MIRRSRTSCERPAGFSRRACHVTCCARYSSIACEKIVLLLRAQRVSAATVLAGGSKSEAKAGEEVSPSPLLLDSVPAFSGTARRVWRGGVSESRSCGLFSVWRRRCFRSDERLIYLWNFNSRETRVPDAAEGPMSSLAYSPNGICSAHEGIEQGRSGVRVWDCERVRGWIWHSVANSRHQLRFLQVARVSASAEPTGVLRVEFADRQDENP